MQGQRDLVKPGEKWVGRPHIYLIDFANQKWSAKDNTKYFKGRFNQILGRHTDTKNNFGSRYIEEDLRHFDDFSVFIEKSASLWVWSKNGIECRENLADPNRGHLIYEHQAVIELLEYGSILHQALLSRADQAKDVKYVNHIRRSLNQLRSNMAEASNFGEIRDLLEAGWQKLETENLRSRISEALSIRESETSLRESRSRNRINVWLTVLFGTTAIPILAEELIEPIWNIAGWWHPSDPATERIFFTSISLITVLTLVAILARFNK